MGVIVTIRRIRDVNSNSIFDATLLKGYGMG